MLAGFPCGWPGVEGCQAPWPERTSTKLAVTAAHNSLLERAGKNRLDKYFCSVVEAVEVIGCSLQIGTRWTSVPRLTELSWEQVQLESMGLWRAGCRRDTQGLTVLPTGPWAGPVHQWGFLFPLYGLFASCMHSAGPGKIIHNYLCLLDVMSWDWDRISGELVMLEEMPGLWSSSQA